MMDKNLQIIPSEIIRAETTLTKFPIHQLSKGNKIEINFEVLKGNGKLETKWKIRNPPNPLAYKIDTLIINRRIEEQKKPLPKIIKLGSLKEIARELGQKTDTNKIKEAILQNAGALINAKFTYKSADGTEKYIEIGDTRYAVIFTGEKLPNGDKADSVYIQLHDIYREILNSSPTRPLDYDYLKLLSPIAQRFYEIISFKIYRAIQNNATAELVYSEFCQNAPQSRFYEWNQVRPQMHRVHKPHLQSQYIEIVRVETIRDKNDKLDWIFVYKFGEKAKGEHFLATQGTIPRIRKIKSNPDQRKLDLKTKSEIQAESVKLTFTNEEETVISKVKGFGVSETKARSLVKSHRIALEREILYFPYRTLGTTVKNASGLFIKAVEEGYEPPESYFESLKQSENNKKSEADQKRQEKEEKAKRQEQLIWERASERVANLPDAERQELWEQTRVKILSSEEYKDAKPAQLKILESVMDGFIRSELIEKFIEEERQSKR